MNPKHRKTLEAIFAKRIPGGLPFRNVEALMAALGFAVKEKEGSRVSFRKDGRVFNTHRPHPGKEIMAYQIRELRELLDKLGIRP
jgi:predicted RNA binding protein YcfA (HicA-like mRNA interferase family)